MEPLFRSIEMTAAATTRLVGTKITYQGLENIPERGGAVVAINHTSYIDFLPAGLATRRRRRRIRYMLKAEMQKALDALQADGTYVEIANKWVGGDIR